MTELLRAAADRRRAHATARWSARPSCSEPHRRRSSDLDPEEAELAKLFTNTWRYIKFAAANQLYMIANDFGLDFERIRVGDHARLPACRRPARRRLRRGPVPVQGHDAARRVQQQQLHARPGEHDRSTRACRCTSSRGSSSATTSSSMTRRASSAWRSRPSPTTSARASATSSSASSRSRRAEVLCTDPYVTVDADLLPLDEVLARCRPARDRRAARSATATSTPSKPVVDIWNLLGRGVRGVTPRDLVGRHPGLQRGRRRSSPCLDRILEAVTLPCEVLVVYDTRDDTTRRRRSRSTRGRRRVSCRRSTPTATGRPAPSGSASTTRRRTSSSSPWPTAATTRRRSTSCATGRARRRRRRRVALHERRPAGRRPASQERPARGWPGCRCTGSRRVGTRDATNSFKAYSTELRPRRRHRLRHRVRGRHRAGRQGAAAPASGRRDPDDLARPDRRARRTSRSRRGSPGTCAGTASRSDRSSPSSSSRAQDDGGAIADDAVLVTGSSGFIGGYVVQELLGRGYEVVGIDNHSKYGRVDEVYDDRPRLPAGRGRRTRRRADDASCSPTATTSSPAPR